MPRYGSCVRFSENTPVKEVIQALAEQAAATLAPMMTGGDYTIRIHICNDDMERLMNEGFNSGSWRCDLKEKKQEGGT